MRYKEITSKFKYYVYLSIFMIGIVIATFGLYIVMHDTDIAGFIMVGVFLLLMSSSFIFFINNVVYGKVDLEKKTFVFGTLLLHNEVPLGDVKYIKKLFPLKIVKISIQGRIFYYVELQANSEKYFM